jgi:hypothetical protein
MHDPDTNPLKPINNDEFSHYRQPHNQGKLLRVLVDVTPT